MPPLSELTADSRPALLSGNTISRENVIIKVAIFPAVARSLSFTIASLTQATAIAKLN